MSSNGTSSIEPINFYDYIDKLPEFKDDSKFTYSNYPAVKIRFPSHSLIISPTMGGKTHLLLNILRAVNGFTRIWICAKNYQHEKAYRWLISVLNKVSKKLKQQIVFACENVSDLPPISSFDPNQSHLLILDDQAKCSKAEMKTIEDYFSRFRHQNGSIIMMSQDYHSLPVFIRRNAANLFIRKLTDMSDLKRIIAHYSLNIDAEKLEEFYHQCVSKFEGFLLITDGEFRCGF